MAAGNEGIVGSAEELQVAVATIFVLVDEFLRLFDAEAQLEGFLSEWESGVEEHFVGIAGTVADGKDADCCVNGA